MTLESCLQQTQIHHEISFLLPLRIGNSRTTLNIVFCLVEAFPCFHYCIFALRINILIEEHSLAGFKI